MRNLLFAVLAVVPAVCFAAPKNRVAAVNGAAITRADVEKRMWSLFGDKTADALINEEVMVQQAQKLGLRVSDADVANAYAAVKTEGGPALKNAAEADMKSQLRRHLLAAAVAAKLRGISVTDADAEAFFRENKARFDRPEGATLIQLTATSGQEAQDMLAALNAGADFKKLSATKCSANKLCPADAAPVTIYRGQLNPAAEKTVFSLKPGGYSGVIENNGYFHIVRLEAVVPGVPADFGQLKNRIREALYQSKVEQAIPQVSAELRAAAKVKLYP